MGLFISEIRLKLPYYRKKRFINITRIKKNGVNLGRVRTFS